MILEYFDRNIESTEEIRNVADNSSRTNYGLKKMTKRQIYLNRLRALEDLSEG